MLGASNEVVHYISQLAISAWIHSSASYKQPTALPELRHTQKLRYTHKWIHTATHSQRVRNTGLSVALETEWPLPKKGGKRLLSDRRVRVRLTSLVQWSVDRFQAEN